MSWIKDKIEKYVVGRALKKGVELLKGRKTLIGAVNLLLWVIIYAMPAFTPDYNWIVELAKQVRDTMLASGLNLDNTLFNAGVGFTVIGLADRLWGLFKKPKEETDNGGKPRK